MYSSRLSGIILWVIKMTDYKVIFQRERKKKGLSQYKLAQLVGITQTSIWEIENGRKKPSLDVFFRLCEALEIKLFPDEAEQP